MVLFFFLNLVNLPIQHFDLTINFAFNKNDTLFGFVNTTTNSIVIYFAPNDSPAYSILPNIAELITPTYMTASSDGHIFVVAGNDNIFKDVFIFNVNGSFINFIENATNFCSGIEWNATSSAMIVTDPKHYVIYYYAINGNLLNKIQLTGWQATLYFFYRNDKLFSIYSMANFTTGIAVSTIFGPILFNLTSNQLPNNLKITVVNDIFIDNNNNIYISGNSIIYIFSQNGTFIKYIKNPRSPGYLYGVCTDYNNTIYVTNNSPPIVVAYNNKGQYLYSLSGFIYPNDVVFLNNKLFVVDHLLHQVSVYSVNNIPSASGSASSNKTSSHPSAKPSILIIVISVIGMVVLIGIIYVIYKLKYKKNSKKADHNYQDPEIKKSLLEEERE